MSEKLLKHFLQQQNSGFVYRPDARDHVLDEEILGAGTIPIVPLGRLEKLLESDLVLPANIIYQGGTLSCVSSASVFLNMWNSLVFDDNPHCESWSYIYKQVPHYQGGTSMNDNLNVLKDKGACLETTLPSRSIADMGESVAQDKSVLTSAMDEEAQNFQIDGYLSLSNRSVQGLYRVLKETPISIAFQVGNTFTSKAGIVPPDPNSSTFGHNGALFDVVGKSNIDLLNKRFGMFLDAKHYGWWICVNWWEKTSLDLRVMSPVYNIIAGKVLKDKRDTKLFKVKSKENNMRLIKTQESPKIFLLDFSNRKHWLCNEDTYKEFVSATEDWSLVEVVSDEVLNSYPEGQKLNTYGMTLLDVISFYLKKGKLGKPK